MTPHVSLVTPVHNGEAFIAASVREMLAHLRALGRPFELIVVSDGSTDATASVAARIDAPELRVVGYDRNRGKGYALCFGLAQARGRLVGWLDADLDIHPDAIVGAVRRFDAEPVDAVIGSKRHPESRVDYPRPRRLTSWGFQMLVRVLLRVNARDTQVGAKLFRREMIDTVLPLLLIKRYAFDLEVLAVGTEFGFDRIVEAPVTLDYRFSGTGINVDAVWRMLVDTLAISYRIHLRHWYVRQYAALQRHRTDLLAAKSDGGETTQLPAVPAGTLAEIHALRS